MKRDIVERTSKAEIRPENGMRKRRVAGRIHENEIQLNDHKAEIDGRIE